MPNAPAISRPDVEGIAARAKRTFAAAGRDGVEVYSRPEFVVTTILLDIPALIDHIEALEARQVKLEAVVGPLARVWAINIPLELSPERPMREAMPGAWPKLQICKDAYDLMCAKLGLGEALAAPGDGDG